MSLQLRRHFLRAGISSVATVVLSGCLTSSGTNSSETETTSPTLSPTTRQPTTSGTTTPSDTIDVDFHGRESTDVTVHYTITQDSTPISEGDVQVPAGEVVSRESGITEQGTYTLTVTVADREEKSAQFDIEGYDLRMGSDLIVWIDEHEIGFGIEE